MDFVSITYLVLFAIFMVLAWLSKHKYSPYILSAFGLAFVFVTAPWAGLVLLSETVVVYLLMNRMRKGNWIFAIVLVGLIFSAFLLCKYYAEQGLIVLPLGISYFTFRIIAYIQGVYRKNIRPHTFIEFVAYMSFFPTFLIGPINLFPQFLSDIRRRQWSYERFSKGLERAFYGYAQLIILGNFFVNNIVKDYVDMYVSQSGYVTGLFLESAHLWLDLYIRFSAYSSIAIGISAMAGFTVPENFRYPFFASNIRAFWHRWHISLTDWCREYIFAPVAAYTRKPYIAIAATMIAIGIWHELSIRYILWGLYHSVGIIIFEKWSAFAKGRLPEKGIFNAIRVLIGILLTIIFVVSSFPVTTLIENFLYNLIS